MSYGRSGDENTKRATKATSHQVPCHCPAPRPAPAAGQRPRQLVQLPRHPAAEHHAAAAQLGEGGEYCVQKKGTMRLCVQLRKNTNLLLNEKNSLVRRAKEKTERELDCRIFTLTKQKQKLQVNKTKSLVLKNLFCIRLFINIRKKKIVIFMLMRNCLKQQKQSKI